MKCMNCGEDIPEDLLVCPGCGQVVQIVPDYNPLDDVLAAQVRGAVSETMAIHLEEKEIGRGNTGRQGTGGRGATGRTAYVRGTGRMSQTNGRTGRTTGRISPEEREMRRRRAEKKKQMAKKKRQRAQIICAVCIFLVIVAGVMLYQSSYTGRIKKGYRRLEAQEYTEAKAVFETAVKDDEKRGEAYTGLAKVYLAEHDPEGAEAMFTRYIRKCPEEPEIYRAAILFYIDTEQLQKIPLLLDDCEDQKVLNELTAYRTKVPEFSLDENKDFDDVQSLELTGSGEAIYYTLDGSEPTASSTKYTEMIRLDEGETVVKAISVNKKGIPSMVVTKTYKVEFPIEDAPSVTPSTGQYDSAQTIEVVVPADYKAYYTTDGSDPDPENNEATQEYTGPIDMPEGNTILSVVLVDQRGRISEVTKRNYELVYSE